MTGAALLWGCGGSGTTASKSRVSTCPDQTASKFGLGSVITFSGTMTYEARPLRPSSSNPSVPVGLGDPQPRPIRFAKVGVVRACGGTVLASTFTDTLGTYSVTFTNTGVAGVVARVWTQTDMISAKIQVVNASSGALHQADSSLMDDSSLTALQAVVNLRVSVGAGGGAFNILDVLTSASDFVKARTGTAPPLVTAYWAVGSCDGTNYSSTDNSIHILGGVAPGTTCGSGEGGGNPDSDEYDNAVLSHEYSHFIAANFSVDDSPGGHHFLTSLDQDIRLAWSEGWATFSGNVIRQASGDPFGVWYVDTDLNGNCGICYEIEGPSQLGLGGVTPSSVVYDTNEVAVSTVLWDIYDTTPSEVLPLTGVLDSLSAGMDPIWSVMTTYLPCGRTRSLASCPGLQSAITTVSMEDFWDGLISQRPAFLASALVVTRDRKMEFFLDSYEPDGTLPVSRLVSLGVVEHHTLYSVYPQTDVDLVGLAATAGQTYTLSTTPVTNGADTFLEILDRAPGFTVLASNDDVTPITKSPDCAPESLAPPCPPNGPTTLGSRLVFIAPATGTYTIRVSRSPSAPPSAGVYGSYDLLVTTP